MEWKNIVIRELLVQQKHCCAICGNPFTETAPPTIDHKIPRTKGGGDEFTNLQLAHHICNIHKGASSGDINSNGRFVITVDTSTIEGRLRYAELVMLRDALLKSKNIKEAAKHLGITYRQTRYLILKHKVSRKPEEWDVQKLTNHKPLKPEVWWKP